MSLEFGVKSLEEYQLWHGVEFLGLVNKQGRLTDYAAKNDLGISKEQKEMFFMSVSLNQVMLRDYDDTLGPVNYTMTEREKFRVISVPIQEGILIVIMNKKGKIVPTIKKILQSLNSAKS